MIDRHRRGKEMTSGRLLVLYSSHNKFRRFCVYFTCLCFFFLPFSAWTVISTSASSSFNNFPYNVIVQFVILSFLFNRLCCFNKIGWSDASLELREHAQFCDGQHAVSSVQLTCMYGTVTACCLVPPVLLNAEMPRRCYQLTCKPGRIDSDKIDRPCGYWEQLP